MEGVWRQIFVLHHPIFLRQTSLNVEKWNQFYFPCQSWWMTNSKQQFSSFFMLRCIFTDSRLKLLTFTPVDKLYWIGNDKIWKQGKMNWQIQRFMMSLWQVSLQQGRLNFKTRQKMKREKCMNRQTRLYIKSLNDTIKFPDCGGNFLKWIMETYKETSRLRGLVKIIAIKVMRPVWGFSFPNDNFSPLLACLVETYYIRHNACELTLLNLDVSFDPLILLTWQFKSKK